MDENDKRLGMDRPIDRRDFLNGVGVMVGASLLSTAISKVAQAAEPSDLYYPPKKTGMRGNHPGSFDSAHPLAWHGEAPQEASDTGQEYDLVVVGGGLSGLAAAIFFQQERGADARILILDNHDDFAEGAYPHQIGRQQFGRISIANSDSEAMAYLNYAVDAAWRAAQEQLSYVNKN